MRALWAVVALIVLVLVLGTAGIGGYALLIALPIYALFYGLPIYLVVKFVRRIRRDRERLAILEARADLHVQTQDARTHPAALTTTTQAVESTNATVWHRWVGIAVVAQVALVLVFANQLIGGGSDNHQGPCIGSPVVCRAHD